MNLQKTTLLILTFLIALYSFAHNIPTYTSDSTIYLNEVIVDGYQINTPQHRIPGAISVLSNKEIQTTDGNNFAHTLHSISGIYMHSGTHATSRIVIRGMGSRTPYNTNRIKSYLNDIPITSSDGISTPEDIDLLNIGRMEIIKGPASTLYGSGLGGNINLYTPKSDTENANLLIQLGSFNTIKTAASGNYIKKSLNIWSSISHMQSNGYRENNRHKRTSLLSSGEIIKDSYSLEYTVMLIDLYAQIPSSINRTQFVTNPQSAAENWKEIEGYKAYKRAIAGATLTNNFSDTWNNRLTLFGRWADSYERRPFNNLDDGTSGGGIRNRLTYHASYLDALIGFEWINDIYRWHIDLNDELINRNRELRNHYNLFGMLYWRPTSNWNISLGGAFNWVYYKLTDQFSENGNQSGTRNFPIIFSPRLGFNYAPSQQMAFYTSVGHGFSMPSPEETLLPEGDINEKLKPEQGIQYELGLRLNVFNNFTNLDASIYRIDLTNLLVTKRLGEDIFTGINAGKTRHIGFELMLKQRILWLQSFPGRLSLNTSYTWSDNRFIDFTDNEKVFDTNKLPGIPKHLINTNLIWQPTSRLDLNANFQFVGEQFIDDANSQLNESYFLINIRANHRIPTTKSYYFELFAGINNLNNSRFSPMLTVNAVSFGNAEPRYYYPGLPRHFYTGIRFYIK